MRKTHIFLIILVACFVVLVFQIVFGNYLSARLATLPGLRNLGLFNPSAPIVVTNKETVRVSDANDAVETANSIKSKLSTIVYYEGTGANTELVLSGGALNWTADGYFITTKAAMSVPNKTYAVVLNSGEIFPIKDVVFDKATDLAIIETDARNLSTTELVPKEDLRPGQKILLMLNSIAQNKTTFLESYMQAFANDVGNQEFNSDLDQRYIRIQSVGNLTPGHAAVDLNGKLAGMWDGKAMVSGNVIEIFASNFFEDNKQVLRPGFGFSFKHLTASEARALQLRAGARVTQVVAGGPAAAAGLQKGDIITSISSETIEDDYLLTESLVLATPGQPQIFEVQRGTETLPIVINSQILD